MKIEEYAKEHIKNLKETNQGHNLVGDCPRPSCRQEGGLYITRQASRGLIVMPAELKDTR
jgi:hypothetical protein